MLAGISAAIELLNKLVDLIVGAFRKSPTQKLADAIAAVEDASHKADSTKGNTEEYEKVLRD
jgi:hypothetical protein